MKARQERGHLRGATAESAGRRRGCAASRSRTMADAAAPRRRVSCATGFGTGSPAAWRWDSSRNSSAATWALAATSAGPCSRSTNSRRWPSGNSTSNAVTRAETPPVSGRARTSRQARV
ncbi:MAG: hypothetical protein R2838_15785 [Caldilineaceae bacterium]